MRLWVLTLIAKREFFMGEDAVFYLFVAVTALIAVVLCVRHLDEIKEKERQKQRQVYQRLRTVELNHQQKLAKELQEQSLRKAKLMEQFHVETFGHDLPIKPVEGLLKVKSQSEVGVKYDVDLAQQTCTCENYKKRRSHPKNHVARWCKHLLRALDKAGAFSPLEGLQSEVVKFSYTQCDQMYLIKHNDLPEMILTLSDRWLSESWININARKKRAGENIKQASGKFSNYGWNADRQSWSYGENLAGASLIRPLLQAVEPHEFKDLIEAMCRRSELLKKEEQFKE